MFHIFFNTSSKLIIVKQWVSFLPWPVWVVLSHKYGIELFKNLEEFGKLTVYLIFLCRPQKKVKSEGFLSRTKVKNRKKISTTREIDRNPVT